MFIKNVVSMIFQYFLCFLQSRLNLNIIILMNSMFFRSCTLIENNNAVLKCPSLFTDKNFLCFQLRERRSNDLNTSEKKFQKLCFSGYSNNSFEALPNYEPYNCFFIFSINISTVLDNWLGNNLWYNDFYHYRHNNHHHYRLFFN